MQHRLFSRHRTLKTECVLSSSTTAPAAQQTRPGCLTPGELVKAFLCPDTLERDRRDHLESCDDCRNAAYYTDDVPLPRH